MKNPSLDKFSFKNIFIKCDLYALHSLRKKYLYWGPHFPAFGLSTEICRVNLRIPYLVQMRESTDQKHSEYKVALWDLKHRIGKYGKIQGTSCDFLISNIYLQIITNNFPKPISGQSSISTRPENINKLLVLWCIQGVQKCYISLKWVERLKSVRCCGKITDPEIWPTLTAIIHRNPTVIIYLINL